MFLSLSFPNSTKILSEQVSTDREAGLPFRGSASVLRKQSTHSQKRSNLPTQGLKQSGWLKI